MKVQLVVEKVRYALSWTPYVACVAGWALFVVVMVKT